MNAFSYSDIIENFDVKEILGKGGQKIVFSANHAEYGQCVLKIGAVKDPSSMERIKREVHTLRSISSEYYPKQYLFHIVDDTRFYILEERLEGSPLTDKLRDYSNWVNATKLILNIVEALMVLWDKRIIHRDIKPANIIITPEGNPRIIDLGIARLIDFSSLTLSFAPFGPCTPNYASPEQLQNRKYEINHRADQFCIGILYGQLLLEGEHPFDPEIVGTGDSIPENIINGHWAKHKFTSIEPINLKQILVKMLDKEPYGRYRTPNDLRQGLIHLIEREK